MYTDEDLEAMKKAKTVFDPDGRLNPGKIFPAAKPGGASGPAAQREIVDKVLGRG
jgi:hypothetical protein